MIFLCACFRPAQAQTFRESLAKAYELNPQLNSARAVLRVTNENVPQALSGYRPKLNANADGGYSSTDAQTPSGQVKRNFTPGGFGVELNQTLFDGLRTPNAVGEAEAQVRAQREMLRTSEQDVLLLAVGAYMDVMRDTAILDLRRNFVGLLGEQLKEARARFEAGTLTRTDVAQSEARQSLARAQTESARAQLNASRANFRRVIRAEPGRLQKTAEAIDTLLPKSVTEAEQIGLNEHPQIRAALYGIDAAAFSIGIAESALLPTVSVSGILDRRFQSQAGVDRLDTAAVVGRVTVPVYDGGLAPSQVRQSKERLGQRWLDSDAVRDQIRALIIANWGNFDAAKAQITAVNAQMRANALALEGVREEARVGQRTVLDTLNAEQELLDSRVNVVIAERNRVVTAYALLGAVGRLNAQMLDLNVALHDPLLHYEEVHDKWHGLRTPGEEEAQGRQEGR